MPAQSGGSVVLSYGAQGSQQVGSAVLLEYALAVGTRRVSSGAHAPWGASANRDPRTVARFDASREELRSLTAPWALGRAVEATEHAVWAATATEDRGAASPWGVFEGRPQPETGVPWRVSRAQDEAGSAPWGEYMGHPQPESVAPWNKSAAADERSGAPWGGPTLAVQIKSSARFAGSVAADRVRYLPWSLFGRTLSPTWGVLIPVHDPADGPEALYVVPIRRIYMQLNNASLRRVEGDVLLPTFSMSLKLDTGSWVWGFEASLPATAQADVESVDGVPVELEAMVNGTPFRLLVDRISRERTFGRQSIAISGRGKAALFDAPFSAVQTFGQAAARTAQQLAGEVLDASAFGLEWALGWGAVDWLVPGGVWSHTGTQMSALNAIAAAAGSYVQPHASDLTLSILPHYPLPPWEWDTVEPDFELPSAVVTRETIEWSEKPNYNRVYVSGVKNGVLGRVTRAGTAGDLLAQMVTDPLITHADAARQRGIPVLANTGRIADISLRLPVLADTGVILPGKFVRYLDGSVTRIGLVRSVGVAAEAVGEAFIVRQTIGVETHVA